MRITEQERAGLATARHHYQKALDALPASLLGYRHVGPLTTSFIASINDDIGTAEDDSAAGWPDREDGWHDRPAPVRRPAYVACPKVDGEPDEKAARFEGCGEPRPYGAERCDECGEPARHSRGDY